ncbi:receptor-type tyrosine-protein kinase FLT3 isoform X2 [Sardina pilchardus]|uniref:receptor-type tyrosine-protein kinase FLT3 isoform X2 n=1 Tax=Sardina pilchardus TaxID=27697 RepID=UPI002E1472FC
MQSICVTCLIAVVVLQQPTVNGKHQQPDGEGTLKFSCAVNEEVVPCNLPQGQLQDSGKITLEVYAGQTIKVSLQNISEHACSWHWGSREHTSKPTVTGKHREGAFVFLFQATDRHAGLATIHCRNDSGNILLNIKLKLKRPSKPYLSVVKRGVGYAPYFVCKSEGSPVPEITWYRHFNKSSIIPKGGNTDEAASMESKIDSYMYRQTTVMCCASNPVGEECSLLYDYDLDDSDSSPPVVVIRGQTLLMRCRSSRTYGDLQWIFNGTKVDQRSGCLFLNSSDLGTSAEFSCKNIKTNQTKTAKINVLGKGFINVTGPDEVNNIKASEKSGFCISATVHSFPLADCHWVTQTGERVKCPGKEHVWKGMSTYELCGQDSGAYQLQLENSDTSVTKNVSLCVTDSPTLKLSQNGISINCVTNSTQPWNLTWKSCQLTDKYNCSKPSSWKEKLPEMAPELSNSGQYCHKRIESTIPSEDVRGHYLQCCLQNLAGKRCSDKILIENSPNTTYLLGVICMLVVIILLVTLLLLYFVKKKKPVYQSQLQMIQMVGPSDNDYIYIDFRDFKYDQKWEFPRENLELGKELGSGAFGMVVHATAYGITKPGVSMQVAVKMLKDKHQEVEREALMSELKMLSYIGHHTNIVNLLGACTHSGPPYLIFQYCCNGDLLNYLKNNRESFHKCLADAITKDRFTSLYHNYQTKQSTSDYQHPVSPYVPMSPVKDQEFVALLSQSPTSMDTLEDLGSVGGRTEMEEILEDFQEDDLQVLTYGDLLCFSYQVAKGMEFLSTKNCIHRDLAARNVLLTRGRLVKIGDFGLARDIDNDSNYVVRGNARLPVKWMAPESIFKGMYTMQSDVWAYGILLWEIFSLGVTPYPGIKVDNHFYSLIERGFQMEQPYYASESVYRMMRRCWALEPQDRPCFSKLVVFMENELAEMEEKIYLNVGEQNNNSSIYQNTPTMVGDAEPFLMSQTESSADENATESLDSCFGGT